MEASRRREVLKHLQLIESSAAFDGAKLSRDLLRYIVEETLAERQPKEITIAVEFFHKDSRIYNPKTDRSVSGLIGKIRSRLARYYASDGQSDAVVISVPVGSYVAAIEFKSPEKPGTRPEPLAFSVNPLAPAGLYATTIGLALDGELDDIYGCQYRNHLFLPKVFAPWLFHGGQEFCFVTVYDWQATDRTDLQRQIVRIYRGSEWPVIQRHWHGYSRPTSDDPIHQTTDGRFYQDVEQPIAKDSPIHQLLPDTLQLAKKQGAASPIRDCGAHEGHLLIDVEHIFEPHPVIPDDMDSDAWWALDVTATVPFYPQTDCYVWFQFDHIAFCSVDVYRD